MENNPYHTPSTNLFGATQEFSAEGVSPEVIVPLQRTKLWVRIVGVLLWISVGLMLLSGGAMVIVSLTVGSRADANQSAMAVGVALLYVVFAILYIYPALKIWKYGSSIGKLVQSRHSADLVAALEQQRAFWKFVGVMVVLMVVLYAGAIMAIGVAGVSSFQKMQEINSDVSPDR